MAAAAAAAVVGTQADAAIGVGARAACTLSAHMQAAGHHPTANRPWRISVTTRPASVLVTVTYQFFYQSQLVATAYPFRRPSSYSFRGHYTEPAVIWPSRAIGYQLRMRVHLTSSCGTRDLNYSIKVHR